MPRDLPVGEAEEPRRVVVENVLLLLDRRKTQAVDAIEGSNANTMSSFGMMKFSFRVSAR